MHAVLLLACTGGRRLRDFCGGRDGSGTSAGALAAMGRFSADQLVPIAPTMRPMRSSGSTTVIHLHAEAPLKPALGAPCNGCGVCCAAEPCPLGVLVSRSRQGRCAALQWSDEDGLYRCGLVAQPAAFLPRTLGWAAPLLGRWARRWIAAGKGCDSACSVA